jgi:hypothetical protein
MADNISPPSITTADLELPRTVDAAIRNNKEVSWSATPKEIDRELIENFKKEITYEIHMSESVKAVLKATFTRFKTTDEKLLLVSIKDPSVVIKSAEDFYKISDAAFPKVFPAEVKNRKTWLSLHLVSSMEIHLLKRHSFGFYAYAARKVWIHAGNKSRSTNQGHIGWIMRKDPQYVNRDRFNLETVERLSDLPADAKTSALFHEAHEALPFEGKIPPLRMMLSDRIGHGNVHNGPPRIHTKGIMISCDRNHRKFISHLLCQYNEKGETAERYVPLSLLHGDDKENIRGYRNAIKEQNKYLSEVKMVPVIGISPIALKEKIALENDKEPATILSILLRYDYFTNVESTHHSETLGKYHFILFHRRHFLTS